MSSLYEPSDDEVYIDWTRKIVLWPRKTIGGSWRMGLLYVKRITTYYRLYHNWEDKAVLYATKKQLFTAKLRSSI